MALPYPRHSFSRNTRTPSSSSKRGPSTRLSYRPNETLTQRNDLQVDLDVDTDYDSFSSCLENTFETSGSTSTPNSYSHNPRLPLRSLQPSMPPQETIIGMLQEQQALLHKIVNEQEEINKAVKKNDHRIALIEANLKECNDTSTCSSSSNSDKAIERRRFITKDLTDKVAKIHNVLEEGLRPEESSLSPHNVSIKSKIVEEICENGKENTKYTEKQVKAAVQRKYEALRRSWKTDDDDEVLAKKAKEKKYRARRRRKFENRSLVVNQTEQLYWKKITIEFMSEESDDMEDDYIVVHQPQWRSEELCALLVKLDERYNNKVKKEGTAMARKPRHYGSPSQSKPPAGAPDWAIDPKWRKPASDQQMAGMSSTVGTTTETGLINDGN